MLLWWSSLILAEAEQETPIDLQEVQSYAYQCCLGVKKKEKENMLAQRFIIMYALRGSSTSRKDAHERLALYAAKVRVDVKTPPKSV